MSNISTIRFFKEFYSLFIITGLTLLVAISFIPQQACALAFVPVKDQALIDLFTIYHASTSNASSGSLSGSAHLVSSIATEDCETYMEPAWSDKRNFHFSSAGKTYGPTPVSTQKLFSRKNWNLFRHKLIL